MARFASRKTRQHAVLSEDFERELTREVLRTELLRVRALVMTGCVMMIFLTAIYLVAMAMLGAHLHHGIWSSMQTLGVTNSARSRRTAKQVAFTLAVIIAGGFSLVPLFIAVGVIK